MKKITTSRYIDYYLFFLIWFVSSQMEWLSEEEKSRSMMPYLLNLPPMDSTVGTSKATITEIGVTKDELIQSKPASKQKVPVKEIETEKWPQLPADHQVLNQKKSNLTSSDDTYKVNCDNHKFLYDLKVSDQKKFLAFTDSDMEILRQLILRNKIKYNKNKKLA